LGTLVKLFGVREGLLQIKGNVEYFYSLPLLEVGSFIGLSIAIAGAILAFYSLNIWRLQGFGGLPTHPLLRMVSFSTMLILIGFITFMMSLIMGFLSLPTRRENA